MTKTEILDFIKANPDGFVATVEGNKPRVRALLTYKADETGIIFQTWTLKDIHQQLQKNPFVEVCYKDSKGRVQVRISGTMELVNDMALKKQVVTDRPFMKSTVESKGWEVVAMYRLKNGKATVWTGAANFAPKTYIDL
jgi:pyridoxamine 5'-phosphate oxidase